MGSFRLTKTKRSFKKKKMGIPFNLLVISYLLICFVTLFSSPTAASFHDTQTMEGRITADNMFKQSEGQDDVVNSDNYVGQQSATSDSNQAEDETADTIEQEQDNIDAKEEHQSEVVDSESKMNEDENEDK